jgi:hypothetical protein
VCVCVCVCVCVRVCCAEPEPARGSTQATKNDDDARRKVLATAGSSSAAAAGRRPTYTAEVVRKVKPEGHSSGSSGSQLPFRRPVDAMAVDDHDADGGSPTATGPGGRRIYQAAVVVDTSKLTVPKAEAVTVDEDEDRDRRARLKLKAAQRAEVYSCSYTPHDQPHKTHDPALLCHKYVSCSSSYVTSCPSFTWPYCFILTTTPVCGPNDRRKRVPQRPRRRPAPRKTKTVPCLTSTSM